MNSRHLIFKCLLIALPFLINLLSLKNGHNWGDDFAMYILHAQNLISGRHYTAGIIDGILVDYNVIWPPLYPLILSPLLYFFGMNFVILKAINVLFWGAIVAGAYIFFTLKKDEHVFRYMVLLAWSSFFFIFKQNVLSDILFTGLVLYAVIFYEYFQKDHRDKYFYLFTGFAVLAYLARSAGLALFVAAVAHLFLRKENGKALFIGIVLAVTTVVQHLLLGTAAGYWHQIFQDPWVTVKQVTHQAPLTLKALLWVFVPEHTVMTFTFNHYLAGGLHVAGFLLPFIVLIFLVRKISARSLSFTGLFLAVYLVLAYTWAFFPQPPAAFARVLLPVYVFAIFYSFHFIKTISNRMFGQRMLLANIVFAVVLSLNCFDIALNYNFNDDVLFYRENQEMFAWVREHVASDEVVMFAKPRALKLMTGRKSTYVMNGNPYDLDDRIRGFKVRYIVLGNNFSDIVFRSISLVPERFRIIWANAQYSIFQVFP